MNPIAHEWQFDGLFGPTHNYAGLAPGNVASGTNAGAISNPRKAAQQGLEKMLFVQGLGLRQAFLPPRLRPVIPELQRIGFGKEIPHALQRSYQEAPHLLAAIYSASFMWAANAATISPSADSADRKLHLTPANLLTNYHRSIESWETYDLLRRIFSDPRHFTVHDPLPAAINFADEGAANHMRVCRLDHNQGLQVFVYGAGRGSTKLPQKFPARQQREAYEVIARLHQLDPTRTFFVQQNPAAIDAGVFHNDVIAMNSTRLMIAHEQAFVDGPAFARALTQAAHGMDFHYHTVPAAQLPLADAVQSYFFNSQLLALPDGSMVVVAPGECAENPRAQAVFSDLAGGNAVAAVHYLDVRESMRNGGGPACLRLRVVLSDEQSQAMHQGIVFTDEKYHALNGWIEKYYRDRLGFDDLRDPALVTEIYAAYEALEPIIGMPGLYTSRMG